MAPKENKADSHGGFGQGHMGVPMVHWWCHHPSARAVTTRDCRGDCCGCTVARMEHYRATRLTGGSPLMLRQVLFYLGYSLRFFGLREEVPWILGLAITDRCDLSCRHCRVSNTGRPDLSLVEIKARLAHHCRQGFRELYVEGGEPFLWKDSRHSLSDVIAEARRIGYFHVHVYTNGLHGLDCGADAYWVSVDGPQAEHDLIRGSVFAEVIASIISCKHKKICIIYTINSVNKGAICRFLEFVKAEGLAVLGVMFYFHTPYYGRDELFIGPEERGRVVEELIRYKRQGLPVRNSYAGLRAFRDGRGKKPGRVSCITDVDGDYVCCRYRAPETCRHCGFTACAEISEAQRLKPSAVLTLMRFW